jgi:hypothetical protein
MRSLLVLLCALLAAPFACAQAIIAQNSGLPFPSQVIDFGANLFPNFTPVSTQFPGIVITHARDFTTGVSNNLVGGFLTNDPIGPPDTLRIQFATPATDVSFVYHQIGTWAPSAMRVLLLGQPVASFSGTWNQSQPNNYFGFTNTLFDELQIDFVADFNLDTLAFNSVGLAACQYYNGSGINPLAFACGTLPQLGTTWQGLVTTNANTLLTAIVYAPGDFGPPLPLFGGELLIQPVPSPIAFTGFANYSLAIPLSPSWTGVTLTFQGLRLDLVGGSPAFVPLNAIRLVLGP